MKVSKVVFYFLCLFLTTVASRLESGASNRLKFLQNGFNFSSADPPVSRWLTKAMIPDYLQAFLKANQIHRSDTFQGNFFDKLFDGVTNNNCKVHVAEWYARLEVDQLSKISTEENKWVLHMIDSWGKLPEGILAGHVNSFGDFDECVQIKVKNLEILNTVVPRDDVAKSFQGEYCTAFMLPYDMAMELTPKPVDNSGRLRNNANDTIGIQESVSLEEFLKILSGETAAFVPLIPSVGVCMPNSCSPEDIQQILVNGLHMQFNAINPALNLSVLPWPGAMFCVDSNKPDFDAGAIFMIVLLSTLTGLALGAGVLDYWTATYEEEKRSLLNDSTAFQYLMAFSFYTNVRKWLSTRRSPDDMGCLHGIRFLSTAWVVLAHTLVLFVQSPQWNQIDINNIYKDWTMLAVLNGSFAVDTFFVMSGMLVTFSILKTLDRSKGRINILMMYIQRYIRLTPTLAILIGITATILPYVGNGPRWTTWEWLVNNCRNHWWTNLLYINNVVHPYEMCNGESWYLANDMQFFILSPFIVYPLWKREKIGVLLLIIYTILSCIAPMLVVRYAHDAPAAMVVTGKAGKAEGLGEIYDRPWSRINVFLVGVWLGWLLFKTKGKRVQLSRPILLAFWSLSTGTALAVIFAIYPWFNPANDIPTVSGYFYAGLGRFSFGVAVAWVIFACVKGYGGIVDKFLSWSVFMPLGRLCFCVYLTSWQIQNVFHTRLSIPIKMDRYTIVNIYFAHMVMSYLLGFVATLLFESPFIILQKLILEGSGNKKPQKKVAEVENKTMVVELNNNNNNNEIKTVKDSTE